MPFPRTRTYFSSFFGIPYLGKATDQDPFKTNEINGYLFEDNSRALLPCVVANGTEARWVVFILDTRC